MNHLEYYKECLQTGLLKGEDRLWYRYINGLCHDPAINKKLLKLFKPTAKNCKEYNVKISGYWAADHIDIFTYDPSTDFGPTRQNIVLLIAAMKGEL